MSDRDIALQLADFLGRQRELHEISISRNASEIRDHIADLAQWEKLVRELAEELE
jgi:hypothetical protein